MSLRRSAAGRCAQSGVAHGDPRPHGIRSPARHALRHPARRGGVQVPQGRHGGAGVLAQDPRGAGVHAGPDQGPAGDPRGVLRHLEPAFDAGARGRPEARRAVRRQGLPGPGGERQPPEPRPGRPPADRGPQGEPQAHGADRDRRRPRDLQRLRRRGDPLDRGDQHRGQDRPRGGELPAQHRGRHPRGRRDPARRARGAEGRRRRGQAGLQARLEGAAALQLRPHDAPARQPGQGDRTARAGRRGGPHVRRARGSSSASCCSRRRTRRACSRPRTCSPPR